MKNDPKKSHKTRPEPAKGARAKETEPTVSAGSTPVVFFVAMAFLLFWSFVYLDKTAGGYNVLSYGPYNTNALAKLGPPKDPDFVRGQLVYNNSCLPCHQSSGLGVAGQFPPLAGSEWVLSEEPDRLIRIVLNGLAGPIMVKGQQWNNAMVAWKDNLNDQQVADVLNFARGSWGNKAPKVLPEKVAEIRKESTSRGTPWSAEDLMKFPGKP